MQLKKKLLATATSGALALALVCGGSATAANAVSAGGGTWYYGVDLADNWSHYFHRAREHRATVENWHGRIRVVAGAGKWAMAREKADISGNRAYWYVF